LNKLDGGTVLGLEGGRGIKEKNQGADCWGSRACIESKKKDNKNESGPRGAIVGQGFRSSGGRGVVKRPEKENCRGVEK